MTVTNCYLLQQGVYMLVIIAAKYNGFAAYNNLSIICYNVEKVNNVWTKMYRFSVWDHELMPHDLITNGIS